MVRFFVYFAAILKISGLLLTGAICAAIVMFVYALIFIGDFQRDFLGGVWVGSHGGSWFDYADERSRALVWQNWSVVEPEHSAVTSWVLQCAKWVSVPEWELPDHIQSVVSLRNRATRALNISAPIYIPGVPMETGQVLPSLAPPRVPSKAGRDLSGQERAIVELSASLAEQRVAQRLKSEAAYGSWELWTLVAIGLGLVTTVLVSLSSTEFGRGDGALQKSIRVLAIVFPALGTAAAAVVAFYSPQAQWAQSSRSLASFSQLHGQIAIGIWKVKCEDASTETSPLTQVLDDWSKRYLDIVTVANAAGASSGGPAGGSAATGGSQAASGAGQSKADSK